MPHNRIHKTIAKHLLPLLVISVWASIYYFQFLRSDISRFTQNISPSLFLSTLPQSAIFVCWVSIPLLVFAIFKGRIFCLKICPVGLIQDILPSWKKVKHSKINLYTFISFFIISVFDIAILAIIDPLITFNRLVVVFGMTSEAIVIFLMPITIIIALNFYTKRFWCFKLCPLGALVDWITIFKSKKMIDLDKRKTLIALGSGFVFGTIFRAIEPLSKRPSKRLLRPPGAIPENDFQDRCIRCGSCIAVCLTKTLTPSFFESGFNGIFTPKLVPQNAECDEYCNKCTTACPTQAIKNLPLNVKRNFKIGTASIAQDRCIAWHDNRLCLICQEYCPYLAIKSVKNEYGIPSPIVINDKCRGCGYCEKNCPARPGRAIEVFNTGAGIFIK